ncbi:MAG: methylmalonyl-CoA mutase family protein, partial [Desulfobacteria bacterium]
MGTIFKEDELAKIEADENAWRKYLRKKLDTSPERKEEFTTVSGSAMQEIYTPSDIREFDYTSKLGFPGKYPYTRGVQASMYRGRLWT